MKCPVCRTEARGQVYFLCANCHREPFAREDWTRSVPLPPARRWLERLAGLIGFASFKCPRCRSVAVFQHRTGDGRACRFDSSAGGVYGVDLGSFDQKSTLVMAPPRDPRLPEWWPGLPPAPAELVGSEEQLSRLLAGPCRPSKIVVLVDASGQHLWTREGREALLSPVLRLANAGSLEGRTSEWLLACLRAEERADTFNLSTLPEAVPVADLPPEIRQELGLDDLAELVSKRRLLRGQGAPPLRARFLVSRADVWSILSDDPA